jgi:hypothetical protein
MGRRSARAILSLRNTQSQLHMKYTHEPLLIAARPNIYPPNSRPFVNLPHQSCMISAATREKSRFCSLTFNYNTKQSLVQFQAVRGGAVEWEQHAIK